MAGAFAAGDKEGKMTEKLTQAARLKNLEDALVKIIAQVDKVTKALEKHSVTPDAHNPGVIGRGKMK